MTDTFLPQHEIELIDAGFSIGHLALYGAEMKITGAKPTRAQRFAALERQREAAMREQAARRAYRRKTRAKPKLPIENEINEISSPIVGSDAVPRARHVAPSTEYPDV